MSKQLRVVDAAEQLGVSRYTIYAWIGRRVISHTRYGRTVRVPASEVRRLIREGTVKAGSNAERASEVV